MQDTKSQEPQAQDTPVDGVGNITEPAPAAMAVPRTADSWWGTYHIGAHRQQKWQIGSLTLWLQRYEYEWRVASRSVAENEFDHEEHATIAGPTAIEPLPSGVPMRRFGFSKASDVVRLLPWLADRAVVTKTDQPLYVFAGEEVTVYLSFPLWVRVEAGDPARMLQEMPVYRMSDTWFGSNTREGELCYASQTFGRLDLRNVARRPYRAISAVKIRNKGTDALLIERINTPLPLLSLYQDEDGQLWTNTQVLERTGGATPINFQVEHNAPAQARGAKLLIGPRVHEHRNMLQRAFSSFVG